MQNVSGLWSVQEVRQGDEVFDGEGFGTALEDRVGREGYALFVGPALAGGLGRDEGLQRVAHHLPALAEGGLDDGLEEAFVAAEGGAGIAGEADDGRFYLGRRGEAARANAEEILDVIPCLQQHRKDAVGLGPRPLGDTLGDLLLDHAHDLGNALAVVQDLEEDLRGDVVREIADDGEPLREDLLQPQVQEIGLQEPSLHTREVGEQVIHRLPVDFHEFQVDVFPLQQILGQYPHAGADFQGLAGAVQCIDDGLRNALVRKKMLAEGLLGAYFHIKSVVPAKILIFFC